ncbi:class I adenylate-forming enzyme family protein [Cryobacterium aureum]|uniref:class I adenylate-forming enzyme family protein n=1 Tax=Cryobacterium aureum TaxID=995037 RepID=UPI00196B6B17|nr:class I adenylate-forming enzyme family protein [Cryobacterium aureum]
MGRNDAYGIRHELEAMNVFSDTVPIGDLLVRSAARHPDRVALAFPDHELTYAQLLAGSVHTARGLYALGVRRGDHVGLLMPNSPEFLEGYFAIALLGCVVVPLNARFRSAELGYVIDHSRLRVVLTTDRISDRTDFRAILSESLPSLAGAVAGAPLDLPEAKTLSHIVMLRGSDSPGFVGQDRFFARASETPAELIEAIRTTVRVRDVAMILYTSGTTAHPKGCLISHEGISRGSMGRMRQNVPLVDHNVYWCPGPLFHIAAMQVMIGSIGLGGTFVSDTYFDGPRALEQIRKHRITSLWPWFQAIMNGLTTAPGFMPDDLASVTSIILIGPPSFLRGIQAMLPQAIHVNGSGMSELSGYYAMSPLDDSAEMRATTGGKPVSGVEVRIIDPETGLDAPRGIIGEILVRGYLLMEGYYRDPEKTAEVIDADGWLHTGDLYVQDEHEHITYAGRLKDMLKVGGENVPAIEVEAFLCTHPYVMLAEVIGRPDERLDEVPVAFVEIAAGAMVTEDELIEYCQGRIASFKVPRSIFFKTTSEWPMSATKVNKVALRRELSELALHDA